MEDDFEYHVVFSPSEDGEEGSELDLSFKWKDFAEPVIFLIGWFGCKDQYLAKYSKFYEKKGCTVVRYIAPPKYVMCLEPRVKLMEHVTKLMGVLHDYSLVEQPIIFHIFSNGGFIVYDLISAELMKEENSKIKIYGCIFDSSPGKSSLRTLARAVAPQLPGGPTLRLILSWFYSIGLFFFFYISSIVSLFYGTKQDIFRSRLWNRMSEEPRSHPQLFLCSEADKLINHEHVLEFMSLREKKGITVSSVVWQNSEHVSHFREHPESYVTHCLDFVKHCVMPRESK